MARVSDDVLHYMHSIGFEPSEMSAEYLRQVVIGNCGEIWSRLCRRDNPLADLIIEVIERNIDESHTSHSQENTHVG